MPIKKKKKVLKKYLWQFKLGKFSSFPQAKDSLMHAENWRDTACVVPERFSSVATVCRNNQVLSHMGISAMSYAVFVNSWQFSLLYNSEKHVR